MLKAYITSILILSGLALATNCALRDFNTSSVPVQSKAPQPSPLEFGRQLDQSASKLFFLSKQIGWVVSNGRLYRTTDGGEHWDQMYFADPGGDLKILFVTDGAGWATINQWSNGHNHLVMRTGDGGRTWTQLLNLESPIYKLEFINDRVGFVRDRWEPMRRTSDGGESWIEIGFSGENSGDLFEGLQHFSFLNPTDAWGYGSSIWRTIDGAETWTEVVADDEIKGMLESATFIDNKHGWIVGNSRQVWRTVDGKSWHRATNIPVAQGPVEEIFKRLPSNFYSVTFVNQNEGWVAANDRTILHSTDGGDTWKVIARFSTNISALRLLDEKQGWALHDDGELLHTVDGGRTWATQKIQ